MQKTEASECKAHPTPPALATNPDSRCNYLVDTTRRWQNIWRYASQRKSHAHGDAKEAQTRLHAPSNQGTQWNKTDQTGDTRRQATDRFRVTPVHQIAEQASTNPFHSLPIRNSERNGNQPWNPCSETQACVVQHYVTNVWPTPQCWYCPTRCGDHGWSTHDCLHARLWDVMHTDKTHTPAHDVTLKTAVSHGV